MGVVAGCPGFGLMVDNSIAIINIQLTKSGAVRGVVSVPLLS